jgi:hypothetical protein
MKILEIWQEFVGHLVCVDIEHGMVIAIFQGRDIGLPNIDGPQLEKLKKLKGKDIGVIRTDIPGKEYLFREI